MELMEFGECDCDIESRTLAQKSTLKGTVDCVPVPTQRPVSLPLAEPQVDKFADPSHLRKREERGGQRQLGTKRARTLDYFPA